MQTVRQIAQQIVDREGGYVDAPEDPGGATNFGVTIYTMRRLGLELDHDGNVDKHDVQMLSRAQAVDIFIKHYFEGPLIAQLLQPLQVRILQRLLIDIGFEVVVDGALGLQSIAAFKATFENAGAI